MSSAISHWSSVRRKGFTLVELMIVAVFVVIIGLISLTGLLGRSGKADLENTTEQIASLLREARARSVSQTSSTIWGVHFGNSSATSPFFALFSQSYGASTTIGYYRLPTSLIYGTSTIPIDSSLDITFSQISGQASASTSITVYSAGRGISLSSTINVASSGAVSF